MLHRIRKKSKRDASSLKLFLNFVVSFLNIYSKDLWRCIKFRQNTIQAHSLKTLNTVQKLKYNLNLYTSSNDNTVKWWSKGERICGFHRLLPVEAFVHFCSTIFKLMLVNNMHTAQLLSEVTLLVNRFHSLVCLISLKIKHFS